jgi:putative (di)nucleoside polyphosphate hydrolase
VLKARRAGSRGPGRRSRQSQIDRQGYRANVGIVICNDRCRLLLAKRAGMEAWQFPQGGIRPRETPEQAMYRELREEIGLLPEHVEVLGSTQGWLRYRLPPDLVRWHVRPLCLGQKQIWFLLRLVADEKLVRLDGSRRPEFDDWRWADFWEPVREVVPFKQQVYHRALSELEPLLFGNAR